MVRRAYGAKQDEYDDGDVNVATADYNDYDDNNNNNNNLRFGELRTNRPRGLVTDTEQSD
jgi:hypothetical protein